MSRKLVYVQWEKNDEAKAFGLAQVKTYLRPDDVNKSFFVELESALHQVSNDNDDNNESSVFATEVLKNGDPCINENEMVVPRKKELRSLLERETFKVVAKTKLPPAANVLSARFVLVIKNNRGDKVYKTRTVVDGYLDIAKNPIVHSSQNIQPGTIRLIIFMDSAHDFEICTADILQA